VGEDPETIERIVYPGARGGHDLLDHAHTVIRVNHFVPDLELHVKPPSDEIDPPEPDSIENQRVILLHIVAKVNRSREFLLLRGDPRAVVRVRHRTHRESTAYLTPGKSGATFRAVSDLKASLLRIMDHKDHWAWPIFGGPTATLDQLATHF